MNTPTVMRNETCRFDRGIGLLFKFFPQSIGNLVSRNLYRLLLDPGSSSECPDDTSGGVIAQEIQVWP